VSTSKNKWLYADKTEKVLGILLSVRNQLGSGWSEEIYHQAAVYALKAENIPVRSKPRATLYHLNTEIHTFEPDVIVWDKIVLEFKVLPELTGQNFHSTHYAQTLHYMNYFRLELGLLINFAPVKLGCKRLIYHQPQFSVDENYDYMNPQQLEECEKLLFRQVRKEVLDLGNQYGLGLPATVYRKLITVQLTNTNIDCVANLTIPVLFNNVPIGSLTSSCLLVDGKLLLYIDTNFKGPKTFTYHSLKSYLRALGLTIAWVINFGKEDLMIRAVSVV